MKGPKDKKLLPRARMHGPGQSWSAGKLGRQTEVEEQVGRSPGGASRHHSTGHNTTPPPSTQLLIRAVSPGSGSVAPRGAGSLARKGGRLV